MPWSTEPSGLAGENRYHGAAAGKRLEGALADGEDDVVAGEEQLRARLLIVVSLAMACVAIVAAQSKAIAVTNVTLIDGRGRRRAS